MRIPEQFGQIIGVPTIERRVGWSLLFLLAAGGMLSTAIAQIASVGIIVLYLVARIRSRSGWVWSRTLLDLIIPLLVLSRIISIVLSVDPGASITTVRTELPFYILPFAFLWLFEDLSELRLTVLMRILTGGAILAALAGILVYAGGYHHRATSLTSGYYTLGMYLTAIFGMVLGLGRDHRTFRRAWLWYGALGILLLGILLTFNRIHWLLAAILILIVGIVRERRLLLVLGSAGAAAVALYAPLRERIMTVFQGASGLTDRDIIWREAARLVAERPLTGFGTRTFSRIFPEEVTLADPGVASWHNDTLQVLLESGLLAAICYVLLMTVPVWLALRVWRSEGGMGKGVAAGSGLALSAVLFGGMTGIFFTDPIIMPLTYLYIALIVASKSEA